MMRRWILVAAIVVVAVGTVVRFADHNATPTPRFSQVRRR